VKKINWEKKRAKTGAAPLKRDTDRRVKKGTSGHSRRLNLSKPISRAMISTGSRSAFSE